MPKRGELSERELKFVLEYLEDQNATRAYEAAGYPSKSYSSSAVTAHKLLKKANIQDAIRRERDRQLKRLHITKGRVLKELSKIAFANVEEVIKWDNSGVHYSSSEELPKEVTAAVAEVTETVTNNGHTLKFKMHDKAKALVALLEKFDIADDENKTLYLYDDPSDPPA
jgi:phage terminase small subunit